MKNIFFIISILLIIANKAYAQDYNYKSQYYNIPNSQSNYNQQNKNNADLEGYYNSQYRGDRVFEDTSIYIKSRYYIELGLRSSNVLGTSINQDAKTVSTNKGELESSDINFSQGYGGAFKFGIDNIDNRFEFEFAYEKNNIDKWNFKDAFEETLNDVEFKNSGLSVFLFNLNYYRDFFGKKKISPYIGVGGGLMKVSLDYGEYDDNLSSASYIDVEKGTTSIGNAQAMIGFRVKASKNSKINVGYKFRYGIGDIEIDPKSVENADTQAAPYTLDYTAHIGEISWQIFF